MKTDGFLPRYNAIECFHQPGNHLFGIKFRISPVIFEKKINFSEYQDYIFPLSYLLDQSIIDKVKKAASFEERTIFYQNIFYLFLPTMKVHCTRCILLVKYWNIVFKKINSLFR